MIYGIFGTVKALFSNSFLEHANFRRFWSREGQIAATFVTETTNFGTFCYEISAAMDFILMKLCLPSGSILKMLAASPARKHRCIEFTTTEELA